MAKRPTINTLANTASPTYLTQLNQNFTNIRDQFDNTLSLDGSTPNAMNADIDLNGNDLINANSVNTASLRIGGENVVASAATALAIKKEFETVALLLADTGTYTNYGAGDYLRVVNGGFTYQVAASGASDHHVTTAGGVKLYIRPSDGRVSVLAFGAFDAVSAAVNTATLNRAIAWAKAYGNNIVTGASTDFRPTITIPAGYFPLSKLAVIKDMSYLRLVGSGKGATKLALTDAAETGALFDLGDFSTSPTNSFSGNTQHILFEGMYIVRPDGFALTQTGTRKAFAIRDNGGGSVFLKEVLFSGWQYGFCGSYGSDFTWIDDCDFRRNDVDVYLGPGSQQVVVSRTQFSFSGEGIVCDAVFQLAVNDCQLIDHKTANVTIEGPATNTRLGVARATLQNNHGGKIDLNRIWFETGAGSVSVPADWHSQRHIWLQNPDSGFPRGLRVVSPIIVSGTGALPAKVGGQTYSFLDAQVGNDIEIDSPLLFGTRIDKLVYNNAALSQRIAVVNRRNVASEASVETFDTWVDNGTVELTETANRLRRRGVTLRDINDFGDTGRYSAKRWADGFEQTLYDGGSGEAVHFEHNYSSERFRFRSNSQLRGFAFRTAEPTGDPWNEGDLILNRGTNKGLVGWLNSIAGTAGAGAVFDVLFGRGKMLSTATASSTSHSSTLQLDEGGWDVTVRWASGDDNHAQFAKFFVVYDAASVNTTNIAQQIGTTITKGTVVGGMSVSIDASGLLTVSATSTSAQSLKCRISAVRCGDYSV